MTPEQFYWNNKLTNKEYMREIRIRSLSWMLECYENGTIRRRTIKGLIPKQSLVELLQEMEKVERYEDCVTIKKVIDRIYNPLEINLENMSKKRQKEIISLLENTLLQESKKTMGGNTDLVEALTKKLEKVKKWKKKDE
jgi:hypothetical protein